ncbi:RHS repeat-associated core domain-containing protein, partial [Acinetobacter baumannii]
NRYYDPRIGRFASEDPKGFEAGINFYAYVGNDPIDANDPSGLCPSCIGAGTSVLMGGAIRYISSGGDLNATFDPGAMATDAVLGAVGAGLANK